MAMGSPLSPVIANFYMEDFEEWSSVVMWLWLWAEWDIEQYREWSLQSWWLKNWDTLL
jgi:hypothetical protein